jgi:acetyl-CoA acetyltransferase
MTPVFICDAVRTPIGKLRGALKDVRADDLAAVPIAALRDLPDGELSLAHAGLRQSREPAAHPRG